MVEKESYKHLQHKGKSTYVEQIDYVAYGDGDKFKKVYGRYIGKVDEVGKNLETGEINQEEIAEWNERQKKKIAKKYEKKKI